MTLKCEACGVEKEFADAEEAFRDGWDAPPHFPYVGCDKCPGAPIFIKKFQEPVTQE